MAVLGLILNVSGVDRDAALSLFGSLVDHVVGLKLGHTLEGQNLGDRRGKGGLAVVDVADGSNVNMGLSSLKFCLCHLDYPPLTSINLG
ncbi:hypothetical protein SDC9_148557 [bioreactor metagenome]|uniref:Uncharacterized protein n=1 Tax=bioreactor metagenome TaxID=1076179 RepID=A0A645EH67_9ZZZZ